jgi:sec-independent protein translocase protein TatA
MFTLLFISTAELLVIMLVIVLLFGPRKIPEIARGLGRGISEFKKATADIKKEIYQEGTTDEFRKTKTRVEEAVNEIKETVAGQDLTKEAAEIAKTLEDTMPPGKTV